MSDPLCDIFPFLAPNAVSVDCQFAAPLFLLACDRPGRAFSRSGVCMSSLPPRRQPATMPKPPVASEVHHELDIHLHFPPKISFDHVVAVQVLPQCHDLHIREFIDPAGPVDSDGIANTARRCMADAVNACQSNRHPFFGRYIDTSNSSQNAFLP